MACFEKPFRIRVGKTISSVSPTPDDVGDGTWTCDFDGTRRNFDLPDGVVDLAPEGEWAHCLFGFFELAVRRIDGRLEYRAETEVLGRLVASGVSAGEEAALWSLANALPAVSVPRACFFCRYSEVEKSTGWGHLCCNVSEAAEYERALETGDRRWPYLTHDWVDEWHGCAEWKLRPANFGYRGGGHRDG